MEVDGGFEILDIPEATDSSLDGHDLALQALGKPVGDRVLQYVWTFSRRWWIMAQTRLIGSNWQRSTNFFHEAKKTLPQ
jgi:hypothetical protein